MVCMTMRERSQSKRHASKIVDQPKAQASPCPLFAVLDSCPWRCRGVVANCGASILLLDLVVEPLRTRHAGGAWRQGSDDLLARVIPILEAARGQVVWAVNHAMVSAYWHIWA